MNVLRALLSIFAAGALVVSGMLHAMGFALAAVLLPVGTAGVVYGLMNSAELLFAVAVYVKLKAHLYEQHQRRAEIRNRRLRKARR